MMYEESYVVRMYYTEVVVFFIRELFILSYESITLP